MFIWLRSRKKANPGPGKAKQDSAKADSRKKNTQSSEQPTATTPLANPVKPFNATDKTESQTAGDKRETSVNITAIPTLSVDPVKDWMDRVLWGATIVLFFVAVYQMVLLKKSTDAADASAKAARGALTLGQNAERAWLLFQGATLSQPLIVGQPILADFAFKNTGKTPALGIWAGANFYIWEGNGEPDPTVYFDPDSPRFDVGAGDIWSGRASRTGETDNRIIPLSIDEWADLRRGADNSAPRRVLFFIGAVQYVDVFQLPITEQTIPHYSNFCAQFKIDATGGGNICSRQMPDTGSIAPEKKSTHF